MKKKKLLAQVLIFMTIIMSSCQVFATSITDAKVEYSKRFLEYLKLENKENVIMPLAFEVSQTKMPVTNPLNLARSVRSSSSSSYSLRDIIKENMIIKNQKQTNSCWAFAALASLESNLALKDYKAGITPVVYDFSERHMEYATSQSFLNNATNPIGFTRQVGKGGSIVLSTPYLTNGTGAINEIEMPFENNEDSIYISEIQNKNVVTQVNDVLIFPSYTESDDTTEIRQVMKEYIKNYGALEAYIHGAKISLDSPIYNNATGAIYCDNATDYQIDHAVVIVGWDDNYSVDNFVSTNKPSQPGAWIIKNSWGTEIVRYTLAEMKQILYENYPEKWSSVDEITDEDATYNFTQSGYKIDANNEAYIPIGDDGFMYVSYEDANIYLQVAGIQDAQSEITYENIYQYDHFGEAIYAVLPGDKIYLATQFDKKTSGKEYLTQVSIYTAEAQEVKVYVNPNGVSKSMADLQQIQLKTGVSEVINPGYHTIEFLEPLKINNDKFVVMLEVNGIQTDFTSIMIEANLPEIYGPSTGTMIDSYGNVTIESGKCFVALEDTIESNQWYDTSNFMIETNGDVPNCDTSIKAFTTSKVLENITIATPPTKTEYVVGQDFDKSGMVVKANYANGDSFEITDYNIQDGTELALNQSSITITYQNKTVTQPISVVENVVEKIEVTTAPTKTEYWAGEDFEIAGMVIQATYTDGTKNNVTDYTVKDGQTLENGQTKVTIEYEGKTTTQLVTVKKNNVVKLEVLADASKVAYVAGQDFNSDGLRIKATYENGNEREVTDYTIKDGTNLQIGQTTVTIEYEGITVTQAITVIEKAVTGITVKTMPTKTEYIHEKESLDLTGGVIEITYNDEQKEELEMTSDKITVSGFDNTKLGNQIITLTYEEKTTQFEIEVKELPKPVNSRFNNMQGNVTRIRSYSYTDKNKKDYTILNLELSNIEKATENEEMKHYYYLSTNPNEENISDWTEITESQQTETGFTFEINTLNVSNHEELSSANKIYLYVKEVATRNGMKSETTTSSVILEAGDVTVEEYVDDKIKENKVESTPAQKEDDTKAPGSIPKAGHDILMICLAIAIITIGKIAYSKYKDIP